MHNHYEVSQGNIDYQPEQGELPKDPSRVHRFQFETRKGACGGVWKCYAYVFILEKDNDPHKTIFGAVLASAGAVVRTPTPDSLDPAEAKELHDKAYLEFLTSPPVEDWVENMAKPAHKPSDVVKKAAAILLSRKQTAAKQPTRPDTKYHVHQLERGHNSPALHTLSSHIEAFHAEPDYPLGPSPAVSLATATSARNRSSHSSPPSSVRFWSLETSGRVVSELGCGTGIGGYLSVKVVRSVGRTKFS
ncbi:hypothetical protein BDP27DRAFT_1407750 [Rhodocollybia butyracea]|uniref:Uncharacterized protein n=1 Tax=Rhodocollybia butyracea TaxID=206335 RepID=A0A9P5PBS4_9AGAR|nr:hypothetical protein BDP27DRAFT_1407750 [Rhodocollybia butyracea]